MSRVSWVATGSATNPCCCGPGCCMYSAQGLVDALFVAADLPDAITLLGVGSLSRSGTGYGDTTNGVIFETPLWAKYVGGVRTTQDCLIDGDGNLTPGNNAVEDQFAASYKIRMYLEVYSPVPMGEYFDLEILRVGACTWRGEFLHPIYGYLFGEVGWKGDTGYSDAYKWNIYYHFNTGGYGYKYGNQNSPLGIYENSAEVIPA